MTTPVFADMTQVVKGALENDTVLISKAPAMAGLMGFYEVNVNGRITCMSEEQLNNTKFDLRSGHDTLVVAPDVTAPSATRTDAPRGIDCS